MRRLTAALDNANLACCGYTAEIGPIGALARVAIGLAFIVLALFWNDASLADPLVGLVVMPHVVTALLALRARYRPRGARAAASSPRSPTPCSTVTTRSAACCSRRST